MAYKHLPDDEPTADDLVSLMVSHPWSVATQRAVMWAAAHVMVGYVLVWLMGLLAIVLSALPPYALFVIFVVGVGAGWLVAAIQMVLADAIFDVTLPHWRRIGLVSGVLAGCAGAAPFVPMADAVPFVIIAGAPLVVLLVLTALQMRALRALSQRAWLWALPMPLAGWVVTGRTLGTEIMIGFGCATVAAFALYHFAGGLVLSLLAHDDHTASRKPKDATP